MKKLYIMIGVSGSGKSTKTRELTRHHLDKGENVYIFSADDYWFIPTGYYKYESINIRKAHLWNLQRFENAINDPSDKVIIIDNTNLERRSMTKYAIPAYENGYEVEPIIMTETNPLTLWRRNSHGVSLEVIYKMINKFKELMKLISKYKDFKEFIYAKD